MVDARENGVGSLRTSTPSFSRRLGRSKEISEGRFGAVKRLILGDPYLGSPSIESVRILIRNGFLISLP